MSVAGRLTGRLTGRQAGAPTQDAPQQALPGVKRKTSMASPPVQSLSCSSVVMVVVTCPQLTPCYSCCVAHYSTHARGLIKHAIQYLN